jgi:hypothetical protein
VDGRTGSTDRQGIGLATRVPKLPAGGRSKSKTPSLVEVVSGVSGTGTRLVSRRGIHAMQPTALPKWMTEKLWRVELTDDEESGGGIVLARRGRLVERINGWDDETACAYAEACIRYLPKGGSDIVRTRAADTVAAAATVVAGSAAASVGYCAAHAAESDSPGGYERERRRRRSHGGMGAWLSRSSRFDTLPAEGSTGCRASPERRTRRRFDCRPTVAHAALAEGSVSDLAERLAGSLVAGASDQRLPPPVRCPSSDFVERLEGGLPGRICRLHQLGQPDDGEDAVGR